MLHDLLIQAIALPALYLLGALVLGKASETAVAPDVIGTRAAVGVAATATAALALSVLGAFSALALVVFVVVIAVAGFLLHRPAVRDLVPPRPSAPNAAALALVAAFLVLATPAFPYVLGGRDPGIYVQAGAVVDRTGDIVFRDQPIAQVPRDVRIRLPFGQGAWPGMLERPVYSGRIEPLGFHLWPAAIASARALGGGIGLWLLPLLAGITLLAIGGLAAALVPERRQSWARLSAIILAGSGVAYLWYARYPTTEMLTGMLLLTGFGVWAREQTARAGLVAGTLLGLSVAARLDPLLVLGPTFVVWTMLLLVTGRIGRSHVVLVASFACVSGLALLEANTYASGTLDVLVSVGRSRDRTLERAVIAVVVIGALVSLVAWRARARLGRLTDRHAGAIGVLWMIGLGLLYLVAFVRGSVMISWRGLDWLVDYLSAPGLVAGAAALMLVVWREWHGDRFERAGPMLGALLASMPLYLANPRVSPDQFWGIRRFIPIVIPSWAVLVAVGVAMLATTVTRRWVAAIAVAGLAAYAAVLTLPTIGDVEYGGAPDALARVSDALGAGTSLALWGPGISTAADTGRIGDSAAVRFGAGAEYLHERFGVPIMSRTNLDTPAAGDWLASQPQVALVTWRSLAARAQPTLPVIDYQRFDATLAQQVPVSITDFESKIDEPPTHEGRTTGVLSVFRLGPADPSAAGKPAAVDLIDAPPGTGAGVAGVGSLGGRRAAVVTAARVILRAGAGVRTLRVTAGGLPGSAPQPVDVSVNGQILSSATLQPGRVTVIDVPLTSPSPRIVVGIQPTVQGPYFIVGRVGLG